MYMFDKIMMSHNCYFEQILSDTELRCIMMALRSGRNRLKYVVLIVTLGFFDGHLLFLCH